MSLAETTNEVAILETREASPTHFLVKIESFSLLNKYETREFDGGGFKWRLKIYPNEDKTGIAEDYLSVYLAISNPTLLAKSWEVNVVFSIFLFNQTSCNYLYSLGRTRRFLPMKQEWGFSKFIKKKVLTDPSKGFVIDNNCVFGAEVFIVEEKTVFERLLSNKTVPYKRLWEIPNFSKLGVVWTSEQFVAGGFKWDVSLYPNEKDEDEGIYAAVFLRLIDKERVKTRFSISIKDQITNKHNKKTGDHCFLNSDWGWKKFIELSTLEDPSNGFIIKDCCHLEIEISFDPIV